MEQERVEELITRAKAEDQQAMEQLLCLAHTSVSYQCRKMLSNEQDAEDLTQEILITVYTKLDSLQEPAAFWGWLSRTVTRHCINFLERTHKDLQFAEDEEGNSVLDDLETLDEQQIPDKAIDNAETTRMIDEIVSSLPEVQRITTLMYYYNEMSVKEIAQTMGTSEGTVKSRLSLARKAIKNQVQAYEKQGIKLYSVSILPFLWYFLRAAAESGKNEAAASACVSSVIASGTAAGTAVAATAAASGTAATVAAGTGTSVAGGVAAHAIGALSGKLIAGVAAAALLFGGGAAVLNEVLPNGGIPNNTEVPTTSAASNTETVATTSQTETTAPALPLDEAYAAYESLLSKGVTEYGQSILYYAYWDLNQDGIPELLAADADGTPTSWTIVEVYTYRDSSLCFCGSTNSRYDYFYYVNDEYLLGMHRMGHQYISVDGHMGYSEEEFEYYNTDPNDLSENGFIKTAIPIAFTENPSGPMSSEKALRIFNDAKDFYDRNIYGRRFVSTEDNPLENYSWIDGVIEHEGGLYAPCNRYTYAEFVQMLQSLFTADTAEALMREVGLLELDGKCYTYILDGVGTPYLDNYDATAILSEDGFYEIQISFIALDGTFAFEQINCCIDNDTWVLDSSNFYGE